MQYLGKLFGSILRRSDVVLKGGVCGGRGEGVRPHYIPLTERH